VVVAADADDKLFVLGLGAQQAGTTWVWKYLSQMNGADFGFAKEYHVFDTIHLPECSYFRTMTRDRVRGHA
jgi:hypothetical protein